MTPWEKFSRKVMGEMWSGATEIDGADVQEWALQCGLTEEVPYDPAIHGDGPADFDVQPGNPIHAYRPEYQRDNQEE